MKLISIFEVEYVLPCLVVGGHHGLGTIWVITKRYNPYNAFYRLCRKYNIPTVGDNHHDIS